MTEFPRPLFWHRGLFLQPQHFQQADRCLQALLIPYQRHLVPHFWGVYRMSIQGASLDARTFQLSTGTFLFPDGSYLVVPETAVVDRRFFDDCWVEGGKPFTVYLGLKNWNEAAANVTSVETLDSLHLAKVATRFAAPVAGDPCADLHAGGSQTDLQRLSFVVKIFWEHEIEHLADYQLIPVARLERTREGIVLSPNFIPPCLTIASYSPLLATVQEIRDQLAARSRVLEGYKRQRGIQTAEFGSRDVVYLLALRTLNRYVPQLSHLVEAGEVHPWGVYGILRQLVGELSSFSETVTVLGESVTDGTPLVPEYRHDNLGECFRSAHQLILQLLDEITAGPEYVLPLLYDSTYFSSEMSPSHFQGRNRFFLVLKTEEDQRAVLQSVATVAKLSSRERLPLLIARALPGISLVHLPNPPQDLPRRAFCSYFAVDSRCEQWELVQKGNNLALYWDNAPDDLEVELMIAGRP